MWLAKRLPLVAMSVQRSSAVDWSSAAPSMPSAISASACRVELSLTTSWPKFAAIWLLYSAIRAHSPGVSASLARKASYLERSASNSPVSSEMSRMAVLVTRCPYG